MLFFGLSGLNETPPSIWPDSFLPPKIGSTQTGCAGGAGWAGAAGAASSARAACVKAPATLSAAAKEMTDRKDMIFDPLVMNTDRRRLRPPARPEAFFLGGVPRNATSPNEIAGGSVPRTDNVAISLPIAASVKRSQTA